MKQELQDTENIDVDWVSLILEAREIGLTVEEVRAFLFSEKSKTTF